MSAKQMPEKSKQHAGPSKIGTKARALQAAKGLAQKYGYNGFSFQHVADLVGIKKPSLYEHFKSKEQLGEALLEDYFEGFQSWANTTASFGPRERIIALFELFYLFAKDGRKFCPLTAFIADENSLPPGICRRLRKLDQYQRSWLSALIKVGKKKKLFKNSSSVDALAAFTMSQVYGGQLSARITKDPKCVYRARDQVLAVLEATCNFPR